MGTTVTGRIRCRIDVSVKYRTTSPKLSRAVVDGLFYSGDYFVGRSEGLERRKEMY